MKVTKIYKCIQCSHQLKFETNRLESEYNSRCPKCGGKLNPFMAEIRGSDITEENGKAIKNSTIIRRKTDIFNHGSWLRDVIWELYSNRYNLEINLEIKPIPKQKRSRGERG